MNEKMIDKEDERDIYLDQFEKAVYEQDRNWVNDANCKDLDIDLVFSNDANKTLVRHNLLQLCLGCKVRRNCFDTINNFEDNLDEARGHGYFAGLNPYNRSTLKKLYKDNDERYKASTELIESTLSKSSNMINKARRLAVIRNAKKPIDTDKLCQEHKTILAYVCDDVTDKKKYRQYLCIKGKGHYVSIRSGK